MSYFQKYLQSIGLSPDAYLSQARREAERMEYDSSKLTFANDTTHKLMYHKPDGRYAKFGNTKYKDFIIYSYLEDKKMIPEGQAMRRRRLYQARATKIPGKWEDDRYSPNNLAINILW